MVIAGIQPLYVPSPTLGVLALRPNLYRILRTTSAIFRGRRMILFWKLIDNIREKPIQVIDLGGLGAFWNEFKRHLTPNIRITAINLEPHPPVLGCVQPIVGDVFVISSWEDQSADVIFSNSLLEHLGTWEAQQRLAQEIRRVGQNYFVQTPNRWFPLEVHYIVPCFQFLPLRCQIWLVRHFSLGFMPRIPDANLAKQEIAKIRLVSYKELHQLFPEARIWRERFFGLVKSFIVIGGRWQP